MTLRLQKWGHYDPKATKTRKIESQTSSAARWWHSASAKHRDLSLSTSPLNRSSKNVLPSSAAKRPSRSALSRAAELARAAFKAVTSWRSDAQSVSHSNHVASHCFATESRSYSNMNQNVIFWSLAGEQCPPALSSKFVQDHIAESGEFE
jgi:hypothetical protein